MMKKILASLAIASSVFMMMDAAAMTKTEHYVFNYDNGKSFEIQLTDKTITWTSMCGPDKGQTETDEITTTKLAENIDVIQWTEKDGTFVTVIFDKENLREISSGKYADGTWLWNGTATRL